MCAPVYSSLLLFTLATCSIFLSTKMVTEGLPLVRQERGTDSGILAGADFLSVFMSSSLRHETTTTTPEPTTIPTTTWYTEKTDDAAYTRETRSTPSSPSSPVIAQSDSYDSSFSDSDNDKLVKEQSSDSKLNDGVIVAVSVSSSVGRTLINKEQSKEKEKGKEATTVKQSATEFPDQNFVASEEHPSIVAEANKSEFSVEESEPITTNRDLTVDFSRGYPASVQPLPRIHQLPQFNSNSDFISQQLSDRDEKLKPIQQTVIYHNNPREPGRARSVSYSTVIQAVPNNDKHWDEDKHYDNSQTPYNNKFQNIEKSSFNDTRQNQNQAESKNDFATPHVRREMTWEKPEESYTPNTSERKNAFTTERNWGLPEKPYPRQHLPTVYGQPEQNYEVDESASVMTNGRIHGVQPNPTSASKEDVKTEENKKTDDNQKVGYVVEGRNYRKYRVEERTADGFIVGEYGVVSHDDGSLRGVRYTADGTISPRLIYDALMKFLSL